VFDSLETLALHRTIASFTEKKKKKKKKRKKERKKKKKERKKKRKEKEGVASLCSGSLSCIIQMQWYSDLLGKE
jgi:FKBP-type peptidyl-prolyl cis-trans isomerase